MQVGSTGLGVVASLDRIRQAPLRKVAGEQRYKSQRLSD